MADTQRALTAPFPPPPPFWKHFTIENIEKLETIKQEAATTKKSLGKKWSPEDLQALDVPAELRYLIPPAAPTEGTYTVFGELQNVRSSTSCFSIIKLATTIQADFDHCIVIDELAFAPRTRH